MKQLYTFLDYSIAYSEAISETYKPRHMTFQLDNVYSIDAYVIQDTLHDSKSTRPEKRNIYVIRVDDVCYSQFQHVLIASMYAYIMLLK